MAPLKNIPLCIPDFSRIDKTIKIRLDLLKDEKLYHAEISALIKKAFHKKLKEEDRVQAREILKDKKLHYRETDKVFIFLIAVLNNTERYKSIRASFFTDEELCTVDLIQSLEEKYLKDIKRLKFLFDPIVKTIRAKLVMKELSYLILNEEEVLFDLIQISTKYLQNSDIIALIETKRNKNIYDKNDTESKEFLDKLFRSIKGNTKSKPKKIKYWLAYQKYFQLKTFLSWYKLNGSKENISPKLMSFLAIPPSYLDRIERKQDNPHDLTLEILNDCGHIGSSDKFSEWIRNNAFMLYEDKNSTILARTVSYFLDLISIHPRLFNELAPFETLNNFPIK